MKKTITQKDTTENQNDPCIFSRSITAVLSFLKDSI